MDDQDKGKEAVMMTMALQPESLHRGPFNPACQGRSTAYDLLVTSDTVIANAAQHQSWCIEMAERARKTAAEWLRLCEECQASGRTRPCWHRP